MTTHARRSRWIPEVLASLSETEGRNGTDIARRIGLAHDGGAVRDSLNLALIELVDAGLARWEGQRWGQKRWYLTAKAAATPARRGARVGEEA